MASKQAQVVRILNSAGGAFFSGLTRDDQSSLFGVLEDYFYEKNTEGKQQK